MTFTTLSRKSVTILRRKKKTKEEKEMRMKKTKEKKEMRMRKKKRKKGQMTNDESRIVICHCFI